MVERRVWDLPPARFVGPNRRYIVRSRSRAGLLALAVAVLLPSLGIAQYAPKWHVGDWWIVKEWITDLHGGWQWQHWRYDVLRTEKTDGRECFVLQRGDTLDPGTGPRTLYYVRSDSCRIIKEVDYYWQNGKLYGPGTFNCPQGMYGPFSGEPQLPLFPLVPELVRDSAFVRRRVARFWGHLRQFTYLADSAALDRYRAEPSQSGGRPVGLGNGRVLASLSESAEPTADGGPDVVDLYTLQLWNENLPWRLYSEWGQYRHKPGKVLPPYVNVREWLVRIGHSGK
jgi:hypothetical protein